MAVGNTPLVELDGIYAKLECTNPTGSIKDRIAKYILDESERRGILRKGMTIVEATSGNTGIAFSCYAKQKGYPITIVMPENMTEERKSIIRGFGANLLLCSKDGSFAEAASIRDEMAKDPKYFNPDQFSNPLNTECHYKTTGQEIISQLKGRGLAADAFVAGVGTGGTLMGVAKALREANPRAHIVAVEPSESPVMGGGAPGLHGIQGIGDGFIPAMVLGKDGRLSEEIDEIATTSTKEAMSAAKYIAEKHGYCVGVSSGANYLAAKRLLGKYKTVVTVLADGYSRYRSQGLNSTGNCGYSGKCYDPENRDCRF